MALLSNTNGNGLSSLLDTASSIGKTAKDIKDVIDGPQYAAPAAPAAPAAAPAPAIPKLWVYIGGGIAALLVLVFILKK